MGLGLESTPMPAASVEVRCSAPRAKAQGGSRERMNRSKGE